MANSKAKILVVDDNSGIRAALKVLLDMNFHTDTNAGNEGLFWFSEIKKRSPETGVVLFRTDASQESETTSPYLWT